MRMRRVRPLTADEPHEVAAAMRERADKTTDKTAAGYLRLGADTIEAWAPAKRKRRR